MMEVTFRAEDHTYWLGPAKLDSVTQLLDMYSTDSGAAFYTPEHAQRGRVVHHLTTMIDDGSFIGSPAEYDGYCDAYRMFRYEHATAWDASESIVWYKALYAGTMDRFGSVEYEGATHVGPLDIKTGAFLAKNMLQLAGYDLAYCGQPQSTYGFILCLQKTGKYVLHRVDLSEPAKAWGGLIEYHTWRRKNKC